MRQNFDSGKYKDKFSINMNISAPIYCALKKYSEQIITPFHMPGHKMGKGLPACFMEDLARIDVTELPDTDNLHFPEGIIREAQELAAKAYGAQKTYFLVNGSSCGIHASIMTACKPGDKVIVTRDCHRSVIGGIILADAEPVYVNIEFDDLFGIPALVNPEKIEKAMADNPEAAAVIITRPNYYGICCDVSKIADIVHSYGKLLIVDEAHGAHLKFSSELPVSSIDAGADICIQSAHKTLPAFTQGAYLHVKSERVDIERLEFNLRLLQTTSPSFIIMASLDMARWIMECFGEELLGEVIKNAERLRKEINESECFVPLSEEHVSSLAAGRLAGKLLDKTRLVFNSRNIGVTGYKIAEILRKEFKIQVEMADMFNIVCISTISDREEDFERLYLALSEMPDLVAGMKREMLKENINENSNDLGFIDMQILNNLKNLPEPRQAMKPGDACKTRGKKVKLGDSAGKISRNFIVPYPPGIPVTCPGEIITDEVIGYISSIIRYRGMVNGVDKNLMVDIIE